MRTDITKLIFTFRNFVKMSKNIAAHKTNRPPLVVIVGKSFLDKYFSPKIHSYKIENKLKDKFYVTFPKVAPNVNQELLR
jgi:hypothetical protein